MSLSIRNSALRAQTSPKAPSIFVRLATFTALARQRRALAKLDAHLLYDIGVTPKQAADESTKPVWNVPQHWQQ